MRRLIPVIAGLTLVSCASSGAFRAGERAENRADYDRAVLEYARAVQLNPQSARASSSGRMMLPATTSRPVFSESSQDKFPCAIRARVSDVR